jgi:hypothetical protein
VVAPDVFQFFSEVEVAELAFVDKRADAAFGCEIIDQLEVCVDSSVYVGRGTENGLEQWRDSFFAGFA